MPQFNDAQVGGTSGRNKLLNTSRRLSSSLQRIAELENELAEVSQSRYEEGVDAGRKLGYQAGIDEIKPTVRQFAAVVEQVQNSQEMLIKEAREFVVTFAFKIVERILGAEQMQQVKLDEKKMMALVRNAANVFAKSSTYIFRVHPETARAMENQDQAIQALLPNATISIVNDLSLAPAECLVESDFGVLDATLMAQLKEIETYFRK